LDPENTGVSYIISKQLTFIGVAGNGNIVITEKIPVTYGNSTQINLTATDTTGLSTTVPVKITLGSACDLNPCNNKGQCQLCRLDNYVTIKPTKMCDNLPLNKIKGYACSCAAGFTGLNCDFNQNMYTITVIFVPKTIIPLNAYLKQNQEIAIKNKYIHLADLENDVNLNDLSVTLSKNSNGIMVLTVTRQSTLDVTYKEKHMEVFEFEYTIPDSNSPLNEITVTTLSTGDTPIVQLNKVSSSAETSTASSGIASGAVAGIAIGAILLLILVVLVLLIIRKRHSTIDFDDDIYSSHAVNPIFKEPYKQTTNIIENVSNPMYDWYNPTMTRKECTQYLLAQGEGAFVIRDSAATPGWHMLGVKTANEVIHEKIRYTEDGKYELLPNSTTITHPRFNTLVDLVQFYLQPQEDVPYCLAMSNPLYDNHHHTQNYTPYEVLTDSNAPILPLKDREIEIVTNLAHSGVINIENYNSNDGDIYTNTEQAKEALNSRLNYLNLNDNDPNYLITGDDCNE